MAISKIPRNYYNDTDHRRDKTSEVIDAVNDLLDNPVLPTPGTGDLGKVPKVNSEGGYTLADDDSTPIEANPDTESTERLDKLLIGDTTYLVNEDVMPTVIKSVRLTINSIHGSDQNVAIRRLRMKNTLNGDYYQFGGSDTCTCSTGDNVSQLIDNSTFEETYIATSKLPFSIDINFSDDIDLSQYNEFGMICSPYRNASPLSVDILVSTDGEHFIEEGSKSNVGFTYQAYEPFYKFGDVVIRIPDYTSGDRGKFLGIDNTDHVVWDDVPNELPGVTSADAGKILAVDSNGDWGVGNSPNSISIYPCVVSGSSVTVTLDNNKTIGDILNDINDGKFVFLLRNNRYIPLIYLDSSDLAFGCVYPTTINSDITSLEYFKYYASTSNTSATTLSIKSKTITTT